MAVQEPRVVRSYQRIFRPDRRIYQVDGRTLPIPGGVPLRWLGWALGSLLAGLLLADGSRLLALGLAATAALAAVRAGRAGLAPALAGGAVLACVAAGEMLRTVDWPLRLVVMPALAATVMTQVTPDGRPVRRFVAGWLGAWLRGWRSVGRPVPAVGRLHTARPAMRVASDEHSPELRRGRVRGPASVAFARPVRVRRQRRRVLVRPLGARAARGLTLDRVRLAEGERMEVRP